MNYQINIGWLYPDLMNTYGDSGNIVALKKRCEWRGIKINIKKLNCGFNKETLNDVDFLFMGGAQDKQQKIVANDIREKRDKLKDLIENNIPGLFICGAYQFLGNYYKEKDGSVINCLKIIDIYTDNKIADKRLIGDIAINTLLPIENKRLLGFENHGGKTFLGKNLKPLGTVIKGYGNNGLDNTEGVIYKNVICTYMHGPILPINPDLTDYLIELALKTKYKEEIILKKIENFTEEEARKMIASRLDIVL